MIRWLSIILLPIIFTAGCGKGDAIVKPDESEMLGEWVPDKRHSNCPAAWMSSDTVLVMNAGGLCEVRNFGKGFFLQDYSNDYNQGSRGVVPGKWQLISDDGKWGLLFDFKLPTGVFRREARLSKLGKTTVIDFWIGWPDTSPRLIMQKSVDQQLQSTP
jgi:hypothetical protein